MAIKAGRRIGSKVKLSPFGAKLYPQWKGYTGKIVRKEVQTVGHGLAYGQRAKYVIGYWVRWEGAGRDYLLGAENLRKS
jgi:hypothetical protein